jgi:hypothetical protein
LYVEDSDDERKQWNDEEGEIDITFLIPLSYVALPVSETHDSRRNISATRR